MGAFSAKLFCVCPIFSLTKANYADGRVNFKVMAENYTYSGSFAFAILLSIEVGLRYKARELGQRENMPLGACNIIHSFDEAMKPVNQAQ